MAQKPVLSVKFRLSVHAMWKGQFWELEHENNTIIFGLSSRFPWEWHQNRQNRLRNNVLELCSAGRNISFKASRFKSRLYHIILQFWEFRNESDIILIAFRSRFPWEWCQNHHNPTRNKVPRTTARRGAQVSCAAGHIWCRRMGRWWKRYFHISIIFLYTNKHSNQIRRPRISGNKFLNFWDWRKTVFSMAGFACWLFLVREDERWFRVLFSFPTLNSAEYHAHIVSYI